MYRSLSMLALIMLVAATPTSVQAQSGCMPILGMCCMGGFKHEPQRELHHHVHVVPHLLAGRMRRHL